MEASADPTTIEPCFPTPPASTLQRIRRFLGNGANIFPITRPKVPNYVWCAFFTGIGGFLFGFDTGSIGPITIMPKFQEQFANRHSTESGALSPTVQGLIVSSILITASLASVVSGPLSDRISRTRTVALGAVVFSFGSTIACSAGTLPQIFVGRCIAGVGEGLFLSAVTVYAVEIAPASSRGRLGSVVQLLITIGIAVGLCFPPTYLTLRKLDEFLYAQVTSCATVHLASRLRSPGGFLWGCRREYQLSSP